MAVVKPWLKTKVVYCKTIILFTYFILKPQLPTKFRPVGGYSIAGDILSSAYQLADGLWPMSHSDGLSPP